MSNFIKKYSCYWGFFLIAAIILSLLLLLNLFLRYAPGGDEGWYTAMADGRLYEVVQPFSGRFLHPFIAGFLHSFFSLPFSLSFFLITASSLFFFLLINTILFKRELSSSLLLIPLFFTPYFFDTLRRFFQPDSLYLLLTALFFLCLFYKKDAIALFLLFPLFLARESTIILGLLFSFLLFFRSK